MPIFELSLSNPILWELSEASADRSPPLEHAHGMAVLNPLRFSGGSRHTDNLMAWRAGSRTLCASSTLLYSMPADPENAGFEVVIGFLRRLRVRFTQALLSPRSIICVARGIEVAPLRVLFEPTTAHLGPTFSRHFAHFGMLDQLDALRLDDDDVAAELLVDAISALEYSDFRRAIIFSAIAAEAAASASVERLHAQALAEDPPPFHYVEAIAGGVRKRIDPIFNLIWSEARGNYLRRALHEARLHIRKPSLLVENEALYQALRRVATTRNDLVHRGIPEQGEARVTVDKAGAVQAISAAHELLQWLGVPVGPWEPDVDMLAADEMGHVVQDSSE
ncbi:MAG: hypothetical protein IPI67_24485 [Myxococcales bacterium]|nr:hypothetical protein [Myxococcales bacterium]